MIPLRDTNPRTTTPYVTWGLIGLNVLVFLMEFALGPSGMREVVAYFGLIPLRAFHPQAYLQALIEYQPMGGELVVSLPPVYLPFLTSMFLHAGWWHVGGNMLYLWIFGDNVEDALGHVPFLLFYLVCGVGASLAHCWITFAFQPHGALTTVVGASGAVAGVLGAYIYLFPRSRVLTLVPIFLFLQLMELPAQVVLGLWFLMQFFNGFLSLGRWAGGGVAFWAHVGGFLLGLLLATVLPKRRRPRMIYL
ncbi:MAG TPA: rhomboid family intramembrane serine protease [Candidatus Saccharimonadales bacterium]|nr:rhomboid family intramembrane serine protease [Candidatus Saccharimonadales bacterium]